jgi:hypothetical protein
MKTMGAKMKKQTKQDVINQLQMLEGITLQMHRILNSLETSGCITEQLAPMVNTVLDEFTPYIMEKL